MLDKFIKKNLKDNMNCQQSFSSGKSLTLVSLFNAKINPPHLITKRLKVPCSSRGSPLPLQLVRTCKESIHHHHHHNHHHHHHHHPHQFNIISSRNSMTTSNMFSYIITIMIIFSIVNLYKEDAHLKGSLTPAHITSFCRSDSDFFP